MSGPTLEFEGDDLEDALRAAGAALGTSPDSLDYEVLEDGRRGVFGLGARRVRIAVPSPRPGEAPAVEPPSPASPDAALATLRRMLDLMQLELTVEAGRAEDGVRIELGGKDRDALTRNGGELLAALQMVLNRMGRRSWPEAGHVQLVCEGFREEESVADLAREVAEVVARTGQPQRLQPMNPYERRIVHVTVGEYPGLATRSEGDGFLKRVVVERSGRSGSDARPREHPRRNRDASGPGRDRLRTPER
jgi:spoIIIJ-associated protein